MAKLIGSKKAKKKNAVGVILIVMTVLVMGGALAAYVYAVLNKDETDARNCLGKGSPSVTAILIDATDPFTARQSSDIQRGVNGLVSNLKEHDELHIYTLRPGAGKLRRPDFNECKPREKGSMWNENVQQVKEKFEKDFKSKLNSSLQAAIQAQSANESPILEALADIGVESFASVPKATPKRLIVVSDLLQNGSGINHYRGVMGFEQFVKLPNSVSLTPRLSNVKYCVLRLERPEARQLQAPSWSFWEKLLDYAGAEPAPCEPITRSGSVLSTI